jgi:hypothetical protein
MPGTLRDLISAMTPETWALDDSKGLPAGRVKAIVVEPFR